MTKKNTVRSRHDEFFRTTFSDLNMVKSFTKEYLPKKISENLDLETLSIAKDSFIDVELKGKYSDLLYSVKLAGKDAFIYFLFEHKSKEDKFVALQLLKYMIEIWYLYLKQNTDSDKQKLPVIIPLLIYHGKDKWRVSDKFSDLLEGTTFTEYIPDFKYEIFDISHLEDENITGSVLNRVVFLTLKYIFTKEINDELPKILKLYNELTEKDNKADHLDVLLNYIITSAKELTDESFTKSIEELKEGDIEMTTIANLYMEKGIEKGIERGKKEGKLIVAKKMIKDGLGLDLVAKYVEIKIEELKKLLKKE